MKIYVINGPNLNILGIREPQIYGSKTYNDLVNYINKESQKLSIEVAVFQSNIEGEIVNYIQDAYFNKIDGIIINPAAYTHTSIAILDALKGVSIPTIEVHLTDIESREEFRKISYVSKACIESISGLGFEGYKKALENIKKYLEVKNGK